jgi:hypothetical protein
MPEQKAKLLLNVFDGTRQPISSEVNLLIKLVDGTQKQIYWGHQHGPSVSFSVPFYNNFGDNYTVIVSANPIAAYVLRWIAGRHADIPEFDPLYTIEAAAG